MLPEFSPKIEQWLKDLRQRVNYKEVLLNTYGVFGNPYLDYIWQQWQQDCLTVAEVWRAIQAATNPETGEALRSIYRSELAETLRLARQLQNQRVPVTIAWAKQMLSRRVPLEQLRILLHQINVADAEDIDFIFPRIADLLLNRMLLCVGVQRYRLREIEFYFHRPEIHPDPYVHKEPEQQLVGRWYYNRAGGIDLTFGISEVGTWGGILLRGVEKVPPALTWNDNPVVTETGYVIGPQNVLRDIVAHLNSPFEEPRGILLDEVHSAPGEVKWRVRRFGLKLKSADDTDQNYFNRQYRFLTDDNYVKQLSDRADIVRQLSLSSDETKNILGYRSRA